MHFTFCWILPIVPRRISQFSPNIFDSNGLFPLTHMNPVVIEKLLLFFIVCQANKLLVTCVGHRCSSPYVTSRYTFFFFEKKLYGEVNQQGDRRQGSQVCFLDPGSGAKFTGSGEFQTWKLTGETWIRVHISYSCCWKPDFPIEGLLAW